MTQSEDKARKIQDFCEAVIKRLASHDEEGLKASELARSLGVSRAWI